MPTVRFASPSLLYAAILFQTLPVLAQEDELFFDMPVVLSANRLEQPVSDAAVSITVIDRQTIEASGARYIPEILRLVPGMQVGYSGNEFGDEPRFVVTYHGHSDQYSKQMQVLIDGRSIYEPFFGGINWKAIPVNINDIERIEVSRGPNLATYGSNSFMAAINIITRSASEDQGSFVQSNLGNNGIADLTYRYGGNSGKLDYRVTLSSYNDEGLQSANRFEYPDDSHNGDIDYRLDYQLDNNNTLTYQGGFGRGSQQTDRNHDGLLPLGRKVENHSLFQFIKWESAVDNENTLLLQYYYNLSDKHDNFYSEEITIPFPAPPPATFDPFRVNDSGDIKTERHNLEFTHFFNPDENLTLIWGLSAQADYVRAPLYLGKEEKLSNKQFRGFANIEWRLNHADIINFGALAEKNDFTGSDVSPRLSFTHAFNRQHNIRIGISQAIRSPFIYEARGDLNFSQDLTVAEQPVPGARLYEQSLLGSNTLMNESIISREIVYFGHYLDSALLFNARLFHDNISNYIDTLREDVDPALGDNVPDDLADVGDPSAKNTVAVFRNPIDSKTTGLELELNYHVDASLRLIASGAIINVSSNSRSIAQSAPQHSVSLMTIKQFNDNYSGSLAYYYVDAFKWTDVRGGTNNYDTLDARLSRKIRFGESNGSVSLVLRNLLADYSNYQAQPSNATAPRVVNSTLAYLDLRLRF